jgi:hypothetical protein
MLTQRKVGHANNSPCLSCSRNNGFVAGICRMYFLTVVHLPKVGDEFGQDGVKLAGKGPWVTRIGGFYVGT